MEPALISIITPSYNRAGMISEAIESVLAQDYPRIEHIIVDGGSSDGTLEILQRYPQLKISSGPDQGMYDALNKGIGVASGEIIGFLNTDDSYSAGAFVEMANLLIKNNLDAVAGQAIYFFRNKDNADSVIRRSVLLTERTFWREITYGEPAFNAWFFHRRVFDIIGKFDITYLIAGDRDFLLRFALHNLTYKHLERVVYRYRAHDDSLSMTQDLLKFSRIADETMRLVDCYAGLLPRSAQSDMKRVRTRDTITAASRSLRSGAWRDAVYYARLGCQNDVFWPAKFLLRIFTGIFRSAGRTLGIYPRL